MSPPALILLLFYSSLLTTGANGKPEDRRASTSLLQLLSGRVALPRSRALWGSTPAQIATKLSLFVQGHASVDRVVPCSSLALTEAAMLREALRPGIDESMAKTLDEEDGRRLSLPWMLHMERQHAHETVALRDTLCAETLKLWAHHLPASAKSVGANLTLPSLPVYNGSDWYDSAGSLYAKSFTCVNGHAAPAVDKETPWSGWPSWPLKSHFKSKGHGPFPFWHFGKGDDGSSNAMALNASLDRPYLYNPGNPMEVWYDMSRNATKFYHDNCDWLLLDLIGFNGQPCIHLMTNDNGNGVWYIFSADRETKQADNEFCCDDSFGALGTMNPRFMDDMWYYGEVNYTGEFYTGKAKRYQTRLKTFTRVSKEEGRWTTLPPEKLTHPTLKLDVWYETDLNGRPLRFAEAASQDIDDPESIYKEGGYLTSDDFPLLYAEYDRDTWVFGEDAVAEHEVDVPAICKLSTTPTCKVPGKSISAEELLMRPHEETWPVCAFPLPTALSHHVPDLEQTLICDMTTGRIVHDGSSTVKHVRPLNGCHEYAVVNPAVIEPHMPKATLGMPHRICEDMPPRGIIHQAAIEAATCSYQGTHCHGSY